ncbi:DoxX family protein [Symbiobacterium thermophilum]|uniref:DoxX family protein n=1 Tax=Symbiobacterium thermophilum TaxID=2734 RepID=A0A1Y2T6J0_SYMTR|nr:DoxX family protein [Symbiobacterium thermophilum]MBY6275878.1 hypothetical protein [Symbiobacterium thermophilum]OTA41929.1 MAG: hypothetical protein A6D92_02760 [Symbiobacterium thermophilum]
MQRLEGPGVAFVPLLLRIPLAAVFLFAGWPKLTNLAGAAALFGNFGLPGWLGQFAAVLEVVGGLLLLLGLGTRVMGLLFLIEMVVATALVNWGQAWAGGTFDYTAVRMQITAMFACLALVLTGGGAASLDALWLRRRSQGAADGAVIRR